MRRLKEGISIIVSETQQSPGVMFTKVLARLGLDFGDAEDVDAMWARHYADRDSDRPQVNLGDKHVRRTR